MINVPLISPVRSDQSPRRTRVRLSFDLSSFGFAVALACTLVLASAGRPVVAQGLFGDGDAQRREAATNLQINELQGQIRNLNGQIEQMGYQLKQLQDQIVKMQKDTDFRLQELESAPAPAKKPLKKTETTPAGNDSVALSAVPGSPTQAPVGGDSGTTAELGDVSAGPPEAVERPPPGSRQSAGGGPQILGAPPQVLGQIPQSEDPVANAAADGQADPAQGTSPPLPVYQRPGGPVVQPVPGVTPKYANVQPVPSARDEYDAAYGYILNGEYDLAERSFKTFLANHPTDRRAGSAQYWLGESYFQRNLHREATDAFLKSYTQYPEDIKAPDSLLKLGLAYQGLGERRAACNAYDELLTKYPKASKTLRDRAQFEKSRGKCT